MPKWVYGQTGLKRLSSLKKRLEKQKAEIAVVQGSGQRKSEAQKRWETLDCLRQRWENYEQSLEIMGGRNSCSKTDPDATFMRMKEDHMRNGQLKPGYNIQIAVNSEYITGSEVFSDRTDYKTLSKFMNVLSRKHRKSMQNLLRRLDMRAFKTICTWKSAGFTATSSPRTTTSEKLQSSSVKLAVWKT